MGESLNARTRIMAIVEILTIHTDEFNTITVEKLCEKLGEYGYTATKRTVLDDLKILKQSPVEIIKVSNEKGIYILKSHFQSAIRKIFASAYSSKLLSDEAVSEVVKYLRRNSCQATMDLMEETTERIDFNNLAPSFSVDLSQTLRASIKNKNRVEMTFTKIRPGDSYSTPNAKETIIVNPVKIVITSRMLALVFTRIESPQKAEFINLSRIESVRSTDKTADHFIGKPSSAVNFFNGKPLIPAYKKHTWILLKIREEDVETVDDFFSSPVQYKKSEEDGFCLVKVYTLIDESLLGALFHLYDRLEIIAPKSLKEYFSINFETKTNEEVKQND